MFDSKRSFSLPFSLFLKYQLTIIIYVYMLTIPLSFIMARFKISCSKHWNY